MAAARAHVAMGIASLLLFYIMLYSLAARQEVLIEKSLQFGVVLLLLETYLLAKVYLVAIRVPGMGGVARSALKGIVVNALLMGLAYPAIVSGVALAATRVYRMLEREGMIIDPRPRPNLLLLLALWPILGPLAALVAGEKLEAMKAISVYAAAPLGWPGGEESGGEES